MASTPTPSIPTAPTRERLLQAAALIFARDGIQGATTREIAREAAVNEVTLFRHFGSKEGLLGELVKSAFGEKTEISPVAPPLADADLRTYLRDHAERYHAMLTTNLPLIRTMVGEIHRFGDNERQVFYAVFRPLRAALLARLQKAIEEGDWIGVPSPEIVADMFGGMIFSEVLRRSSPTACVQYSVEEFLDSAVSILLGGLGEKTAP